jgi:phosphinothricin acetyltransferase
MAGFWKLVARVFVENVPSRKLLLSLGFREVGVHEKHARLDGVWRDVVVVERLLPANL